MIGRTSNELKHNFSTPNELEHVHLLVIELEHPIFGFERTDIEPNRAFTRFTKLLIERVSTKNLHYFDLYFVQCAENSVA